MTAFAAKSSKYGSAHCLTIQFVMGGETHVAFTGSGVLLDQCRMYQEQMPFLTTIRKIDKYYSFT